MRSARNGSRAERKAVYFGSQAEANAAAGGGGYFNLFAALACCPVLGNGFGLLLERLTLLAPPRLVYCFQRCGTCCDRTRQATKIIAPHRSMCACVSYAASFVDQFFRNRPKIRDQTTKMLRCARGVSYERTKERGAAKGWVRAITQHASVALLALQRLGTRHPRENRAPANTRAKIRLQGLL